MAEIRTCDAAGKWFTHRSNGLDDGIYEEGDAEPILRFSNLRDEAELRIAVESYRVGRVHGERIGRIEQLSDLRRALGVIGLAKDVGP